MCDLPPYPKRTVVKSVVFLHILAYSEPPPIHLACHRKLALTTNEEWAAVSSDHNPPPGVKFFREDRELRKVEMVPSCGGTDVLILKICDYRRSCV